MKRRDSLKALGLATMGVSVGPLENRDAINRVLPLGKEDPTEAKDGRTPVEQIREAKLKAEKFFTDHELKTVAILSDIIVPADGVSGSATQAGVPAFIEFMMKDQPDQQTPMRGGLNWLDNQCRKRYGKTFADCDGAQRIELVDLIAYPEKATPEFTPGVAFFNRMRNLTMTGFFTTEMGWKDVGYMGNTPNQWDGVPADVLQKYGLAYD